MSAQVQRKPEKQVKHGRGRHPNAQATHFKPGVSPNPGGQPKGWVSVPDLYRRLSLLGEDELRDYSPVSALESGVKNAILRVMDAKNAELAHMALKELADRTSGKATENKQVS